MNFDFGGKKCKLHCPKCRKQNLFLSEEWNGNGIYFTITDGLCQRKLTITIKGHLWQSMPYVKIVVMSGECGAEYMQLTSL
jgi:hypothetical protein